MALKSMSIEKLVALKGQIEAMLSSKVLEQRRALESELAKLGRFQGGKSGWVWPVINVSIFQELHTD
jgi:hypothetical protein